MHEARAKRKEPYLIQAAPTRKNIRLIIPPNPFTRRINSERESTVVIQPVERILRGVLRA